MVAEMVLWIEAGRALRQRGGDLAVETMIAARAADWLLIHLVDRTQLMDWLGEVEV